MQAQELTVASAADLAPLSVSLSAGFERQSGTRVRFSFASSGTLARQIENGAPFDVFLSADEQLVRGLSRAGLVNEPRVYAIGRLVLWSRDSRYRSIEALKNPDVRHIAIANPAHAPYGRAARQALDRLGIWKLLESKVVLGENVRQAFEMARSGNADIAIVAPTLAGAGAIVLPKTLHDPIRQAGAVVTLTKNAAAAAKFMDYLISPEGTAILISGGLEAPTSPKPAAVRK